MKYLIIVAVFCLTNNELIWVKGQIACSEGLEHNNWERRAAECNYYALIWRMH